MAVVLATVGVAVEPVKVTLPGTVVEVTTPVLATVGTDSEPVKTGVPGPGMLEGVVPGTTTRSR